jgi:hypothetical protein
MRLSWWAVVCALLCLALHTWLRDGQQDLRVHAPANGSALTDAVYVVPDNVPVQPGGAKVLELEDPYPPPYEVHKQTFRLRPAVGPVETQQAKTVDSFSGGDKGARIVSKQWKLYKGAFAHLSNISVETFAFVSCLVWLLLLAGEKVSTAHVSQLRTNGELSCVATP